MPKSPESEILAKFFADMGEKCGENSANFFANFRPSISPCRKRSPAKGVWQKSDEKSDRSIRKSDRKVTESIPKTKKSDRTPFAALLLRTLTISRKSGRKKFHEKSSTNSTSNETKFLSHRDSGSCGAQGLLNPSIPLVKTVPGPASPWNRFWRDFLEVWGVPRRTS